MGIYIAEIWEKSIYKRQWLRSLKGHSNSWSSHLDLYVPYNWRCHIHWLSDRESDVEMYLGFLFHQNIVTLFLLLFFFFNATKWIPFAFNASSEYVRGLVYQHVDSLYFILVKHNSTIYQRCFVNDNRRKRFRRTFASLSLIIMTLK